MNRRWFFLTIIVPLLRVKPLSWIWPKKLYDPYDPKAIECYHNPTQGYDWSITRREGDKVILSLSCNGQEMPIGELKSNLKSVQRALDKAAQSWGVPANLDGRGRKLAE